jgi:hypothetical protein
VQQRRHRPIAGEECAAPAAQVATAFDTEMEKVTKQGADPAASLKAVQQQAQSIGTGQ